jgi:D-glucuronyl C5-epimerase-like protein
VRAVLVVSLALVAALACTAQAAASPVLVLQGKRVVERQERFLGPTELPPPAAGTTMRRAPAVGAAASKGSPTRKALARLFAAHKIGKAARNARLATLGRAMRAYRSLGGTRKAELSAVIANADSISAAGRLTPSRLAPVFQTLARNTQWWRNGSYLAYGQRVGFAGSELVWRYYPGQGIQLQMLGNFAKANALWKSKKRAALRSMLDELVPLASVRGGSLTWEYWFRFGGGVPPWTSAISQGTAVQSIGRAGKLLGDRKLTDVARRALRLFTRRAPAGVRKPTSHGAFYLIYTFTPGALVLNAHLQATIGLYDFTQLTGDRRARALFRAGESEARHAVPRYDTGAWSLYDQTYESDLSYHDLVTTFLNNLCKRVPKAVFCNTAARFERYLKKAPVVRQRTRRIRAGRSARLGFALDKISRVGLTVSTTSGRVLFATSAVVRHGKRYFTWAYPAKRGTYRLRLSATDLAGNRAKPRVGSLQIR